MLVTSKPKQKLKIPVRGKIQNKSKNKIAPLMQKPKLRLKVRK